jgi:hypothetical protein
MVAVSSVLVMDVISFGGCAKSCAGMREFVGVGLAWRWVDIVG